MSIERPPSLVLAFLAACAIPAAAIGADTPPKAAEPNVAPADPARNPPFIVHNPDGTMTVQKEPASGKTENAGQKGLVIPPQVVVPTFSPPTDRRNRER
jgi:hypothetical protein